MSFPQDVFQTRSSGDYTPYLQQQTQVLGVPGPGPDAIFNFGLSVSVIPDAGPIWVAWDFSTVEGDSPGRGPFAMTFLKKNQPVVTFPITIDDNNENPTTVSFSAVNLNFNSIPNASGLLPWQVPFLLFRYTSPDGTQVQSSRQAFLFNFSFDQVTLIGTASLPSPHQECYAGMGLAALCV
jgi:hypothetical protein